MADTELGNAKNPRDLKGCIGERISQVLLVAICTLQRLFVEVGCVCACVCMCACVHVCMCMHACVHVCMCACVHVCMCACVRVCMCACVHVCMRLKERKKLKLTPYHFENLELGNTRRMYSIGEWRND